MAFRMQTGVRASRGLAAGDDAKSPCLGGSTAHPFKKPQKTAIFPLISLYIAIPFTYD